MELPLLSVAMTTQPITIELPQSVLQQLQRIAAVTHQSIEALVAQSVLSNLPPSADNAPPELQQDLLNLQTLSTEALWEIAQAQMAPSQHQRQLKLLNKHETQPLNSDEQQELTSLRQAADHLMLRKAYAWSLLRWRGERIPALSELSAPV